VSTTRRGQQYRHTPAFILLILTEGDAYGATLLSRLESELPAFKTDSAIIYRTLQMLEDEGAVESYWETETGGPPRKWYRLTPAGRVRLKECRDDIAERVSNLQHFLQAYAERVGGQ